MKRLTILTLEFPPFLGGIAVYLKNVCAELGEGVHVITPPAQKHENNHVDDGKLPYKVTRKKLLFPRFIIPRWLRAIVVVHSALKVSPTDLLMTSQVLPLGYVLLFFKKTKKLPYWINVHGMDVLIAQRSKWKTMWLKKILSQAQCIVVNTEFTKREVTKLECVHEENIILVYPCPDTHAIPSDADVQALRERLALSSKKVIFSLGRLVERKGFERVMVAMTDIVKRHPAAVYVIGGEGPRVQQLQTLATQLKLQNNVRFVGPVYDDYERAMLYSLADIFVMPTITSDYDVESFGIVYLEAAMYGVPSIASDAGGAREAIIHGSTGIIIQTPTPRSIADAVILLLEHPEYRAQLGSRAQERVRAEFIWAHQMRVLKKLLS